MFHANGFTVSWLRTASCEANFPIPRWDTLISQMKRSKESAKARFSSGPLYLLENFSLSRELPFWTWRFEDFFVWYQKSPKIYEKYRNTIWWTTPSEIWNRFWGSLAPPFFHCVWWTIYPKAIWFSPNGVANRRLSCTFRFSNFKSTQISVNQNEPVWTLSFWE